MIKNAEYKATKEKNIVYESPLTDESSKTSKNKSQQSSNTVKK